MSVSCVCCVLPGIGVCEELITVQMSSTSCGLSQRDRGTSQRWPRSARAAHS
jgi:hypothetical protein